MKQIKKKKYCKLSFTLMSPLSLGGMENNSTDKDLIKNKSGIPYIPASSVAGVCRALFDEKESDKYFGYVEIANTSNQNTDSQESNLLFYDACLQNPNDFILSVRDCVALDDAKVAVKGAKFDMEILEPGVRLVTYIEQNILMDSDEAEDELMNLILGAWLSEEVQFGGKTMRGYGRIGEVEADILEFNLEKDVNLWIEFDMYDESCWKPAEKFTVENYISKRMEIRLEIKQTGGISIRKYTTKVSSEMETMPDYEQLTVKQAAGKEGEEIPVIPGTTWAGAFLHRMKQLCPTWDSRELFGYVTSNDKRKSKISFSESEINDAISKINTRNAINRFSGGTTGTALFTEKTYYNGTTSLIISWPKKAMDDQEKKILAASICDLNNGYLAVGGLTAIGRGTFEIQKINGKNPEQNLYMQLLKLMEGEC